MLDREVYLYAEVDRLIGLSPGTARRWINGYERSGTVHSPILRPSMRDTEWVTWGEFVEARILAEYRDEKIPTKRLRGAIEGLRRFYGIRYPMAHLRPYLAVHDRDLAISGEDVGLSEDEALILRTGQHLLGGSAWTLIAQASLAQDETGEKVVTELRPDPDFPDITISPDRYSGQPTFVGRRVLVATIAGMANAGERPEDLAADYGLSLDQVKAAKEYAAKYGLAA
ncbi:DUF433 domain-containing protein [soil metagenome]